MKEKKRDPNAQTTDEDGNMIRKLKAVLFSPLVVTAMLFGVIAALIAVIKNKMGRGP